MRNRFKYCQPTPCWYNGCYFHSLLELRYALMIEDQCYYIRKPYVIPFDRRTKQLPKNCKKGVHFYVPDFLICPKKTLEKTLVEIKPRFYTDQDGIACRKKLVHRFLRRLNLPWSFKIITDNEIQLSAEKQRKYQTITDGQQGLPKSYKRSFETIAPVENGTGLSGKHFCEMMLSEPVQQQLSFI